jgi:hypothetical protein
MLILEKQEIIASALSLSNDTMEGRWVEQVFAKLCGADTELQAHQAKLLDIFGHVTKIFGGFGFCLSEVGDLLSQWRGYADNGMGVSVGFNSEYLRAITAEKRRGSIQKVIYAQSEQEASLGPLMDDIKRHVKNGALNSMFGGFLHTPGEEEKKEIAKASAELWTSMVFAFPSIYKFKNPAFSEEREWRLLTYLVSPDGQMDLNALDLLSFGAKRDRLVPMQSYRLEALQMPTITNVILGPKNITPEEVMTAALAKYGFRDVKVSRSAATYR